MWHGSRLSRGRDLIGSVGGGGAVRTNPTARSRSGTEILALSPCAGPPAASRPWLALLAVSRGGGVTCEVMLADTACVFGPLEVWPPSAIARRPARARASGRRVNLLSTRGRGYASVCSTQKPGVVGQGRGHPPRAALQRGPTF